MSKKIKVGVIFGGRSAEHEVSLVSATSVIQNLDNKKYQVIKIGITKDSKFITKKPLETLKSKKITEKGTRLIPEEILNKCDVIIPVLHGTYGEDGTIQGMLEMADIPYVGAGVLGSAAAIDKVVQKQLTDQAGLPSVPYMWFWGHEYANDASRVLKGIEVGLRYPVFTKPASMGSSIAITKCHDKKELILGIQEALKYDNKIIVEQGIEEVTEVEVSVLGNQEPKCSVLGQIIASNEFYDYDAKYVDGRSEAIIPAELSQKVTTEIQDIAIKTFKVLNLSGMARIDFFVTKSNKIYLNEPNTFPGFTSISMYPKMWEASGVSYPVLLDKLIKLALQRYRQNKKIKTSYKPKSNWYK